MDNIVNKCMDNIGSNNKINDEYDCEVIADFWTDVDGNAHKIIDMDTAYIFNCIRLKERWMWGQMRVPTSVSQKLKRKMIRMTLLEDPEYNNLVSEFMLRLEAGTVLISDLLITSSKDKRIKV